MQDVLQSDCGLGCFESHLGLPVMLFLIFFFSDS